ncbi:MAG: radical SAM protein [Candidatus Omnitrophica bacterium]|nr:radical SAM protein [Candidatus Omnitrophota bacterium]
MRLRDKISAFISVLKVKFLKRRIPLAVRFQLTNRCTLQCRYCNLWRIKSEELSTQEIYYILDRLAKLGTKRISFSGGEPLLREDIGKIIDYCRKKNIYPEMNSNGTLLPYKIGEIRNLDFLKLSLDGPEEIHDFLRGKGSYKSVIKAAEVAYKNKIRFGFAVTLTRYNIEYLDFVLEVARRFHVIVAFQPLKQLYRGVEDIGDLVPSQEKFRLAISKLIVIKKKGDKHIRNSLLGLKHIYYWPKYKKLKCWAGRIFCIIETNGDIYPCDRISYDSPLPNVLHLDFKQALYALPEVKCSGCGFCGSLELNYLMGFKFGVLSSIKKIIN